MSTSFKYYFKYFCIIFILALLCFYYLKTDDTNTGNSQFLNKSYFDKATIIEEGFGRLERQNINLNKIDGIAGAIVNHHLLASHLIVKVLVSIVRVPKTIVLLSPNHFNLGTSKIQISSIDWETPYGILESDDKLVETLKQNKYIKEEQIVFKREHGISAIVPFIKKIFPDTKIVPLVVKDSLTKEEVQQVVVELSKYMSDDVLIIGSFDFSHDSLPEIAKQRDFKSLSVIDGQEYDKVFPEVSVDSKPGLYLLLKLMEAQDKKFTLVENTNSAILTKNPKQEDTTSYIVGYFK